MIKLLGQLENKKNRIKKWVFITDDKEIIEISHISNKSQDILYIPTHYNCPLGCDNCNLKDVCKDQELKAIKERELMQAIEEVIIPWDKRLTTNTKVLVCFNGVGEPLLNMPLLSDIYSGQCNFERLGYTKIAFEVSTMMPNESLEDLSALVQEGKYPIRVVYRMESPLDDKRKVLTPKCDLSIDTSLAYLHRFNEMINSSKEVKRKYRDFFGSKGPVEILYDINLGVNDTAFELAILQYLGARYNIPINFLKRGNGEEKWKEDIMSHYPEMKVRMSKPMVTHDDFIAHLYEDENNVGNIVLYEEHTSNKDETIKKVLENKVV